MPKLKYRIREIFDDLSEADYSRLRRELPYKVGCSMSTIDRWAKIEVHEAASIPEDKMELLAKALSTNTTQLRNYSFV